MEGRPVNLHIDTGVEVTVITEQTWKAIDQPGISPVAMGQTLRAQDFHTLSAKGRFTGMLKFRKQELKEVIYVVKVLTKPLLGHPAIEQLHLIRGITAVAKELTPMEEFPLLFQGLEKIEGEHTIQLEDDAKPFALSTLQRVVIPLPESVKQELQRMEDMGMIAKVQQSTQWCAGMVVVPKQDGRVRICVDLTKLNQSVKRERHPPPAVDQVLAQLAGAKVFSKLDTNSGFWQIPLDPASSLLTTFITHFGRYCFHHLPFGISSALEHFQRRMGECLKGLSSVVCMMDNTLVHGRTCKEHDKRLLLVLQQLSESGMTLNSEKCQFAQESIKFLGPCY